MKRFFCRPRCCSRQKIFLPTPLINRDPTQTTTRVLEARVRLEITQGPRYSGDVTPLNLCAQFRECFGHIPDPRPSDSLGGFGDLTGAVTWSDPSRSSLPSRCIKSCLTLKVLCVWTRPGRPRWVVDGDESCHLHKNINMLLEEHRLQVKPGGGAPGSQVYSCVIAVNDET